MPPDRTSCVLASKARPTQKKKLTNFLHSTLCVCPYGQSRGEIAARAKRVFLLGLQRVLVGLDHLLDHLSTYGISTSMLIISIKKITPSI